MLSWLPIGEDFTVARKRCTQAHQHEVKMVTTLSNGLPHKHGVTTPSVAGDLPPWGKCSFRQPKLILLTSPASVRWLQRPCFSTKNIFRAVVIVLNTLNNSMD